MTIICPLSTVTREMAIFVAIETFRPPIGRPIRQVIRVGGLFGPWTALFCLAIMLLLCLGRFNLCQFSHDMFLGMFSNASRRVAASSTFKNVFDTCTLRTAHGTTSRELYVPDSICSCKNRANSLLKLPVTVELAISTIQLLTYPTVG